MNERNMTDSQVNDLIDQYLMEGSHKAWETMSPEDKEKVLGEQLRIEEEYNKWVAKDWHE